MTNWTEIVPGNKLVSTGCAQKEKNMAGSIAQELFAAIKLRDYCVYVSKLNKADAITVAEFHKSYLASQYVLDTRVCFSSKTGEGKPPI